MATVKELQAQLKKLTVRRDSLLSLRFMKHELGPKQEKQLSNAAKEADKIKVSMDKTAAAIKKREAMLKRETSKLLKAGRGGGGGNAGNPTIDMGSHKVRLVKDMVGK